MNQNLRMVRGNDFSFNIAITVNGVPANITGASLRFVAKWTPTDLDAAAIVDLTIGSGITVTSATSGTATITIPRSATNINAIPFHRVDLPYDLLMTSAGSAATTVLNGTLTILPSIADTSP